MSPPLNSRACTLRDALARLQTPKLTTRHTDPAFSIHPFSRPPLPYPPHPTPAHTRTSSDHSSSQVGPMHSVRLRMMSSSASTAPAVMRLECCLVLWARLRRTAEARCSRSFRAAGSLSSS